MVDSIGQVAELFLISADEAQSNGLHSSRLVDPHLTQARAPKKSVWQARRKDAVAKDRKRLKDGLPAIRRDPSDEVREESSDEEVASKHKTPLNTHPTTSLSNIFDMNPYSPPTITASSHANSTTLNDMRPAPSTETLLSPPMSPHTCDIDPLDSVDD